MGAAFLLLETKNVVQFALLFGTTWLVNSLVFAGILIAVLGAIEMARRSGCPTGGSSTACCGEPRRRLVRPAGGAALAWSRSRGSSPAIALAFAPVFLANLIFSQRFRDVGASTVAFGANLLGAMLGGVLEYGAIVVGYRNLLLLVGDALRAGVRHGAAASGWAPTEDGSRRRRDRRSRSSAAGIDASRMSQTTSPRRRPSITSSSR